MATKRKTYGQGCKCKNTNCLKRNCVCFAAKLYCNGACSCKQCFNTLHYQNKVDVAREEALHRNPYAFTSKEGREKKQKKGCLCRVTNCWTNKCSCYANEVGCRGECQCVGCDNDYGKRGDNFDMIIGTNTSTTDSDMAHVDQLEIMSPFTPQDINDSHPSSVANLPNIRSQAESSYLEMNIGTRTRDFDLNLPTVDQLEDMNRCRPQDFDASTDDDRKL